MNPSGRYGHIAYAQAAQHFHLLTSGQHPKYAPDAIDRRKRQSHSTPALVDSGQGNVFIPNIENGIPRHERGSVAVRTQTEVREIERRRRSGDLAKYRGAPSSCGLQISRLYRHGMDLFRAQRSMLKQTFLQVGKDPIRIPGGGHTLVDLKNMHTRPGNIFVRERP
jgi:hypothetical protein